MPTVVSAVHHSRAARPMPDQRCVPRCLKRPMAPPHCDFVYFVAGIDPRCQGPATPARRAAAPGGLQPATAGDAGITPDAPAQCRDRRGEVGRRRSVVPPAAAGDLTSVSWRAPNTLRRRFRPRVGNGMPRPPSKGARSEATTQTRAALPANDERPAGVLVRRRPRCGRHHCRAGRHGRDDGARRPGSRPHRVTTARPSTRCSTTAATTPRPAGRSVSPTATTTGPTSTCSTARTTTATPTCRSTRRHRLRGRRRPSSPTRAPRLRERDRRSGNTTHGDTLYIPVPLFANPPPTQCTATATCIDHPPTIDLSRIAGALPGNPSRRPAWTTCPSRPTTTWSAPATTGCPEWWNVEVVATTDPATFATLTSVQRHQRPPVNASKALRAPTNVFLFFQVLPGTVPAAQAADLTATAPPGPAVAAGTGRTPGQPGRAGHDDQQPEERLRRHGTQLPEHRHQPRLDRRPGRRRALHRAVLLRTRPVSVALVHRL